MNIFKGRKASPQIVNLGNHIKLSNVHNKELLDSLTAEFSAWQQESFTNERIMFLDAGIDELARRLGTKPGAARNYLVNYAEMNGVSI